MSPRGFTLAELVVACGLVLAVVGAVATISLPLRHAVTRTAGTTDLLAASRTALDRLAADVRVAGHGAALASRRLTFARVFPSIEPLTDLDGAPAPGVAGAVRITAVPARAPQARLAAAVEAGALELLVETEGCPSVDDTCGFATATAVGIFDAEHAELAVVDTVPAPGLVRLRAPLASAFGDAAAIAVVSQVTYGTRLEADGSSRLVRRSAASEQPLASGVVLFEVQVFRPDPFQVRRVDVRLRLQATDAALRGPAGPLFVRSGESLQPSHWVPDLDLRLSVAPRNLRW